MKGNIFKITLGIWLILWVSFITRELFRKGYFYDYKALIFRSLEGKRSYVTGDRFYEFLTFCNERLPPLANYGWVGVEPESVDMRRAAYYLYPHLEKKDYPDFILVYDKPMIAKAGYETFIRLDYVRYILKRKGDI